MAASDRLIISNVEIRPIDIPITDPFVVATGRMETAENLFIRLTLRDGSRGYGEIAPFPDLTGEDRASSHTTAQQLAAAIIGTSAAHYRRISEIMRECAPSHPAARCGMETALLDAFCRSAGIPLWALWGGADVRDRETDITLPITDRDRTVTLALAWYARGFRTLKMKVGADGDEDIRRLEAICALLPDVGFILDANEGFSRQEAAEFTTSATNVGAHIHVIEQPVAKDDLDGLAWLRRSTDIPVAADESVRSLEDAKKVIQADAVDFINVKITKSGLIEAGEIAGVARASGIRLMIGGMIETRVAMGCSFSLALGLGGFELLDLDTPLLLTRDPVKGGYHHHGPVLHPWSPAGLDVEVEGGETSW